MVAAGISTVTTSAGAEPRGLYVDLGLGVGVVSGKHTFDGVTPANVTPAQPVHWETTMKSAAAIGSIMPAYAFDCGLALGIDLRLGGHPAFSRDPNITGGVVMAAMPTVAYRPVSMAEIALGVGTERETFSGDVEKSSDATDPLVPVAGAAAVLRAGWTPSWFGVFAEGSYAHLTSSHTSFDPWTATLFLRAAVPQTP